MSSDHPSNRLPGEERRKQIIEAAIDLFSRKGFKGTTTKEIAQAVGVTEAIIFRHFATKEALYTAIIDHRLQCANESGWFAEFEALMEGDDDEGLFRRLAEAIIAITRDDVKFERLMLYAALEGNEMAVLYKQRLALPFIEKLQAFIKRRQQAGALMNAHPHVLIGALVGMAAHYAQHRYLWPCHKNEGMELSDEEAVDSFTRILMEGARLRTANAGSSAKGSHSKGKS